MMSDQSCTLLDPVAAEPYPSAPMVADDQASLIAGRYRLLRPLGEGGMGNVYLARDQVLAREVAIKTIRAELNGNEEVRTRIQRECLLHAAIGTHPNIVTLYDTVEENGNLYLVLEYFAGQTLASLLATTRTGLPLDSALDIVRQILQALVCIHGRDIVHRDIKTANILLQSLVNGRYLAKLTDFGIAWSEVDSLVMTRLTSLGVQGPGTPVYMAPERIDPQTFGEVGPASDLYAVGIILFELLAGTPPFTGTMTEIFSGHLVQTPGLANLLGQMPPELHAALSMALAKQPGDRFASAQAFLDALAGLGEPSRIEEKGTPLAPFCPPPEPTLLAAASDLPADLTGATVLHPILGRDRTRTQGRRLPRWWLAVGIFLVVVLLALMLRNHQVQAPPAEQAAPPVATTPDSAPVPEATTPPANETAAETPADSGGLKENSALQAVEKSRQQERDKVGTAPATASPPVNRAARQVVRPQAPSSGPAEQWPVMENHTRKIQ